MSLNGLSQMILPILAFPWLAFLFFLFCLVAPFLLFYFLVCSDDCRGICHGESILTGLGIQALEKLNIQNTAEGLRDRGRLDCIWHTFRCTCCRGKCFARICAVLLVLLVYLPVCMVLLVIGLPFAALGGSLLYFYIIISFWVRKSVVLVYRLLIDRSLQFWKSTQ